VAASNYDDVLGQLRAAGLIVDRLEVGTSRPVRCLVEGGGRERRGWYILHELTTDRGDLLIVGSFGVWRGNENHAQKVELRKTEISREQREALRKRLAEDRRRADQARKREAERAAARAASAWKRLDPEGDSEYLARKGVVAHGLRFTRHGTAVVPLLDTAGRIHGLQFLRTPAAAKEAKRPAKEFWPPGLAKKGQFHLIGVPGWIVLVAEGYATAATLHMATGHAVAVAFDAGNLGPVATALRKRYRQAKILICADDDILGHCHHREGTGPECRARIVLPLHGETCPKCGNPHGYSNAGIAAASTAALGVDGAWLAPTFADPDARHAAFLERGTKITDFNDLHAAEGLHVVRVQVEARLSALRWSPSPRASLSITRGGGDADRLRPIQSLDELLERFALVYAAGGAVFDRQEHCLMPLKDMQNACIRPDLHKAWMTHADREIVRTSEVGFDPAETDPAITCNLWGGWPTAPRAGSCDRLLDLLRYMCQGERNAGELYDWVLRWIAYPIQHPGAKMKTTVVVHGPQGTGKNLFFEAVMAIYGPYGRILDQDALIDKHNDWASRKLFLIADEVVAQAHRYEQKNKLKTLITGTWIRINPKHIAAHDEANHVNLVFLSNETMPVVLEEDDRRHCIIWSPPKREADYYKAILAEIDAGGVAALHDFLLNVDLGDFNPGTPPPDTAAKDELVGLAQDSPVEFVDQVLYRDAFGLEAAPGLTTDWYEAYKLWCSRVGVRPAPMRRFVNAIERKRGIGAERKRYVDTSKADEFGTQPPPVIGPHSVLLWSFQTPEGGSETAWLGECIRKLRVRVDDLRGGLR
jgi:putative DNA primase/helicase